MTQRLRNKFSSKIRFELAHVPSRTAFQSPSSCLCAAEPQSELKGHAGKATHIPFDHISLQLGNCKQLENLPWFRLIHPRTVWTFTFTLHEPLQSPNPSPLTQFSSPVGRTENAVCPWSSTNTPTLVLQPPTPPNLSTLAMDSSVKTSLLFGCFQNKIHCALWINRVQIQYWNWMLELAVNPK